MKYIGTYAGSSWVQCRLRLGDALLLKDRYNTDSWVNHRLRLGDGELLIDFRKMQDPGYRPWLVEVELLIDLNKMQDHGYRPMAGIG